MTQHLSAPAARCRTLRSSWKAVVLPGPDSDKFPPHAATGWQFSSQRYKLTFCGVGETSNTERNQKYVKKYKKKNLSAWRNHKPLRKIKKEKDHRKRTVCAHE